MDFLSLLNTVITLALVMASGFIGSKFGVIDEVSSKKLSLLILSERRSALGTLASVPPKKPVARALALWISTMKNT